MWYFIVADSSSATGFKFESFSFQIRKKSGFEVPSSLWLLQCFWAAVIGTRKNSGCSSCSWCGGGVFGRMITVCSCEEVTEACSCTRGLWTLTREICYASISLSARQIPNGWWRNLLLREVDRVIGGYSRWVEEQQPLIAKFLIKGRSECVLC